MKKEKIVLGWLPSPIGGLGCLLQEFVDSLFSFLAYDSGAEGRNIFDSYTYAKTGYIASGRCDVIKRFLDKTDAKWLLMLDWDITFQPQDVYKLIDEAGDDHMKIVSGCYLTYFGGDNLLRPCWMAHRDGEDFVPVTEFEHGAIIPLTVCGMGFTLIHRTLLEKMKEEYKGDPWPWFGHDEINGSRVGEDITFTSRARKLGATIWGHGGVQLGHTKAKTLRASDMLHPQYARSSVPEVTVEKTILSVGSGTNRDVPSEYEGWTLKTLDIDPIVEPDIIADARYMAGVKEKFDAIYCSHNIEHYEKEDVPKVLRNFYRILTPGGEVNILTPDLDEINKKLDEGAKETDIAYQAPSGAVTYYDMLHGWQQSIKAGNEYMKHHTVFNKGKLEQALKEAGFENVVMQTHGFDLAASARKPK